MSSQHWTLTNDDGIARLVFNAVGASANTLSGASMAELEQILDRMYGDDDIRALVIASGRDDQFIVGADIGELATIGSENDARSKSFAGHRIFQKIEKLTVPTIAVIHGGCLGGGLELALACTYRIATDHDGTKLGLPEVGLGILPGWGGTQRLPKLVGLAAAMPMILTGKPVAPRKALRMGLIDAIVAQAFIEEHTKRFVDRILEPAGARSVTRRRRTSQPKMLRLLAATRAGRSIMYRKAAKQVAAKTKGLYPAPAEALAVIRYTYRAGGRVDGYEREADGFAMLAMTSVSRNLVWLFQASRQVRKGASLEAPSAEPMRAAGVVGAGIMGGGIAWALSRAGLQVRMKDIDWDAAVAGMAKAAQINRGLVKRRKMSETKLRMAMHRIAPAITYTGFGTLDVVIEAVVEDIGVKRAVLREIEQHVPDDAIICTNTSSLALHELADVLERPERFVGLHFFNPVDRMPLVEVVPGDATSATTIAAAANLVRQLGKTPIIVGDCPGFLVNRILLPYLIESAWMVEEGVEGARIDRLLERFGMPMGPLSLVDEVGIDVGYKVARILEDAYGDRMHVPAGLAAVVESGDLLGRKNGRGFYIYRNGHKKPNRRASKLVANARQHDGIERRAMGDDDIVDRAVLIMVNEAARCLEERVVTDPVALDTAMVMGTGFAPFRGGLLRYADAIGLEHVRERLGELASTFGDRFRPTGLIEQMARTGATFHAGGDGHHATNGSHTGNGLNGVNGANGAHHRNGAGTPAVVATQAASDGGQHAG